MNEELISKNDSWLTHNKNMIIFIISYWQSKTMSKLKIIVKWMTEKRITYLDWISQAHK